MQGFVQRRDHSRMSVPVPASRVQHPGEATSGLRLGSAARDGWRRPALTACLWEGAGRRLQMLRHCFVTLVGLFRPLRLRASPGCREFHAFRGSVRSPCRRPRLLPPGLSALGSASALLFGARYCASDVHTPRASLINLIRAVGAEDRAP